MTEAIWHDVECGSYDVDLRLWRALVEQHGAPVLDVGAGTGRVTRDLARAGHEVIALDVDELLIEVLRQRRGRLPIETVVADARSFSVPEPVRTIIVPMQTIQLLGGAEARIEFLRCARRALLPGGLLAMAIADALEAFTADDDMLPVPDMREIDGVVYASSPMAVTDEGDAAVIHRVREIVALDGTRTEEVNVIRLDRLSAQQLEAEALGEGFSVLPREMIAATDDYVGSTVVMLRG